MSVQSNFLENELFNHIFRNIAYTSPTTVYIAFYTSDPTDADTGTEVVGGGYVRKAVTFTAPTNGAGDNSALLDWGTASANWGNLTHFAIRDALTAGNLLLHGPLAVQRNVKSGDTIKINANELDVSFSGIASNFLANAIYNHVLRNITYTSPSAVYVALYISDPTPADTGGEVSGGAYARLAVTFGAPSNGTGDNSSQLTFVTPTLDWGLVSHSAIRDALTLGNLLTFNPVADIRNIQATNSVKILVNNLIQQAA